MKNFMIKDLPSISCIGTEEVEFILFHTKLIYYEKLFTKAQ